jgi:hypothetical protein
MNRIVITLTTVPERLSYLVDDGFKSVIQSLCEQNYDNYEVHINLPYVYSVTGELYIIPEWLVEFQSVYQHLKVFKTPPLPPPPLAH